MTERFFNFISFLNDGTKSFEFFLISSSIIVFFFLIVLILSIFVKEYSLKRRSWFIFASASVCVAEYAIMIEEKDKIFFFLSFALSLLLSAAIYSVRVRKTVDKKQKQLIDYIDSQIRRSANKDNCDNYLLKTPVYDTERQYERQIKDSKVKEHFISTADKNKKQAIDLDFSHVKSVLLKLNYYPLSASDRKQVKDLEYALITAENGELNYELKEKINDGLGVLLKIMSKYGV